MEILDDLYTDLLKFSISTPRKSEEKGFHQSTFLEYLTDALTPKDRKALQILKIKISFSTS